MGKCVFNPYWIKIYPWVEEIANKSKARCWCCSKDIDIAKMGESALKSHAKGEIHKKREVLPPVKSVRSFTVSTNKPKTDVKSETSISNMTIPPPTHSSTATATSTISSYVSKNDVLKAEIIWTLRTIVKHASYKSNEDVKEIFTAMFPDSEIAQKFTLGERKTAYLSVFGLAEHFKTLLVKKIRGPFVALFDESLNKKMQEKQMDMHIRFWDPECQEVVTRYLGSQFLGHAKAVDLVEHFKQALSEMDLKNLVQVSMDGPAVNLKFFDILQKEVMDEYSHGLIDIGSCGLHVLHNAFKKGSNSTQWDIASILGSLYYLFKDAPSRQEDYKMISATMPLKFVSHRWLENVPVAERAIKVWEHVQQFVHKVETKQIPKPDNKSYRTVNEAVKDKLIVVKLEFFCTVAKILEKFLSDFQTDRPMTPFLSQELVSVIRSLMRKFIKPKVLEEANTPEKLLRVDTEDTSNHLSYTKVDVGLKAEARMKEVKVSEREMMEFKMESKNFLINTLKKIKEKCPVGYAVVRNMASLNPAEMCNDHVKARERFRKVVRYLLSVKTITDSDGEEVLQQYDTFLDSIPEIGSDKFTVFNPNSSRLDSFFKEHLSNPRYEKLLNTVKLLLILSHGQATVERGFSVNEQIECENLSEQSLVSQRIICDHVKSVNGVMNVKITNQMLVSAANARHKYDTYLEKQRQMKQSHSQQLKRKSTLEEIEEIKKRKKQAQRDQDSLVKNADDLCIKAENTGKLEFLSQANASRKRAKEKTEIIKDLDMRLEAKLDQLKK